MRVVYSPLVSLYAKVLNVGLCFFSMVFFYQTWDTYSFLFTASDVVCPRFKALTLSQTADLSFLAAILPITHSTPAPSKRMRFQQGYADYFTAERALHLILGGVSQ